MFEYYTEVCNSFRKEPEIFAIRQTFFLFLLCLLGASVVLYLVVGSMGLKIGNYLAAAGIPLLLLLYVAIRAAGDRLSLGYIYKRLSYPRTPKYIRGSSARPNQNDHENPASSNRILPRH
ncbi:MAG TPA: hypothetical protein VN616_18455 [Puia sp.]|nr:hypothetical protein [Puia sp.]